jgi:hypothetical protein
MTDSHIESLYQEARSALKSRDYDYAIELLKRVLVIDENYKDTSRLLEKAVRSRKLRWYKNPRLWGTLGLVVVFVLGFVIAPRIGGLLARPAPTETPSLIATRTAMSTLTSSITPTRTPRPTATATPLPAWITTVLAYITQQAPTFDDDFSSKKEGWGDNSEGMAIFSFIENGYLLVEDVIKPVDDWGFPDFKVPGVSFPTTGLFNATDFALQFAFAFDDLDSVSLQFRSAETLNTGYRITVNRGGSWKLIQPDDGMVKSEGYAAIMPNYNKLLVIATDRNLSVFLNDKLILVLDDLAHARTSNSIIAVGLHNGTRGRFDNFKFWNLDAVDFTQ